MNSVCDGLADVMECHKQPGRKRNKQEKKNKIRTNDTKPSKQQHEWSP